MAREFALQALYAFELSNNPIDQVLNDPIWDSNRDKNAMEFANKLVRVVIEKCPECDGLVRKKVANWDFKRIAVMDRLILCMAICEFLFFDDIPPKVSIDEAIEVAKKYSTENSGRFINGILDAVLLDLKKANRIHKSGRGLIDKKTTGRS